MFPYSTWPSSVLSLTCSPTLPDLPYSIWPSLSPSCCHTLSDLNIYSVQHVPLLYLIFISAQSNMFPYSISPWSLLSPCSPTLSDLHFYWVHVPLLYLTLISTQSHMLPYSIWPSPLFSPSCSLLYLPVSDLHLYSVQHVALLYLTCISTRSNVFPTLSKLHLYSV